MTKATTATFEDIMEFSISAKLEGAAKLEQNAIDNPFMAREYRSTAHKLRAIAAEMAANLAVRP